MLNIIKMLNIARSTTNAEKAWAEEDLEQKSERCDLTSHVS